MCFWAHRTSLLLLSPFRMCPPSPSRVQLAEFRLPREMCHLLHALLACSTWPPSPRRRCKRGHFVGMPLAFCPMPYAGAAPSAPSVCSQRVAHKVYFIFAHVTFALLLSLCSLPNFWQCLLKSSRSPSPLWTTRLPLVGKQSVRKGSVNVKRAKNKGKKLKLKSFSPSNPAAAASQGNGGTVEYDARKGAAKTVNSVVGVAAA